MKFFTKNSLYFVVVGLFVFSVSSLSGNWVIQVAAEESAIPEGLPSKPEYFKGFLNYVDLPRKTVVLNDMTFKINKQTRYYSSSGAVQTINAFRKDEVVEFKATDDMMVTEMRSSKKGNANSSATVNKPASSSPSDSQTIRLENGVWTN